MSCEGSSPPGTLRRSDTFWAKLPGHFARAHPIFRVTPPLLRQICAGETQECVGSKIMCEPANRVSTSSEPQGPVTERCTLKSARCEHRTTSGRHEHSRWKLIPRQNKNNGNNLSQTCNRTNGLIRSDYILRRQTAAVTGYMPIGVQIFLTSLAWRRNSRPSPSSWLSQSRAFP